jgi:hypothetical protein
MTKFSIAAHDYQAILIPSRHSFSEDSKIDRFERNLFSQKHAASINIFPLIFRLTDFFEAAYVLNIQRFQTQKIPAHVYTGGFNLFTFNSLYTAKQNIAFLFFLKVGYSPFCACASFVYVPRFDPH